MITLHKEGIDLPIGEQINHYGTIVECFVDENNNCVGCCFEDKCERVLLCTESDRADKKMVKFKEVSKE